MDFLKKIIIQDVLWVGSASRNSDYHDWLLQFFNTSVEVVQIFKKVIFLSILGIDVHE